MQEFAKTKLLVFCLLIVYFCLLIVYALRISKAIDTISPGQSIRDGSTLVSKGSNFDVLTRTHSPQPPITTTTTTTTITTASVLMYTVCHSCSTSLRFLASLFVLHLRQLHHPFPNPPLSLSFLTQNPNKTRSIMSSNRPPSAFDALMSNARAAASKKKPQPLPQHSPKKRKALEENKTPTPTAAEENPNFECMSIFCLVGQTGAVSSIPLSRPKPAEKIKDPTFKNHKQPTSRETKRSEGYRDLLLSYRFIKEWNGELLFLLGVLSAAAAEAGRGKGAGRGGEEE